MACEAARHRYEEAVAACAGDHEAVAKIDVVHTAEPLPGRADRMLPHLKSCKSTTSSTFDADTSALVIGRSETTLLATPSSAVVAASRESEDALCQRLAITRAQLDGVISYLRG